MVVKELKKDQDLTKVRVKLPEDVLKQYKDYGGGEPEMYIAGSMMGDFFMSPDPPDNKVEGKATRRLYPMPQFVEPKDILEWEVAETLQS